MMSPEKLSLRVLFKFNVSKNHNQTQLLIAFTFIYGQSLHKACFPLILLHGQKLIMGLNITVFLYVVGQDDTLGKGLQFYIFFPLKLGNRKGPLSLWGLIGRKIPNYSLSSKLK